MHLFLLYFIFILFFWSSISRSEGFLLPSVTFCTTCWGSPSYSLLGMKGFFFFLADQTLVSLGCGAEIK